MFPISITWRVRSGALADSGFAARKVASKSRLRTGPLSDAFDGSLLIAAPAASVVVSSPPKSETLEERAVRLHAQAIIVDGHNDTPWLIREYAQSHGSVEAYDLRRPGPHETDLARLRTGGVSAQFWSVWIPSLTVGSARMQLEQIDLARRMIAAYPEVLVFATRAADIRAAKRAGTLPRRRDTPDQRGHDTAPGVHGRQRSPRGGGG